MKIEYQPLWQLEQQIKHYRGTADAFRADAIKLLQKADEADRNCIEYEEAAMLLKQAKKNIIVK